MTVSKAQQAATAKYVKKNYDTTLVRFKKGAKAVLESTARENNESLNAYVNRAIKAQYEAETGKDIDLQEVLVMSYPEYCGDCKNEISDKDTHIRLEERLKNFDGEYVYEEIDWGQPAGDEIW